MCGNAARHAGRRLVRVALCSSTSSCAQHAERASSARTRPSLGDACDGSCRARAHLYPRRVIPSLGVELAPPPARTGRGRSLISVRCAGKNSHTLRLWRVHCNWRQLPPSYSQPYLAWSRKKPTSGAAVTRRQFGASFARRSATWSMCKKVDTPPAKRAARNVMQLKPQSRRRASRGERAKTCLRSRQ